MDELGDHVERAAPGYAVGNDDRDGVFVWWAKAELVTAGRLDIHPADGRALSEVSEFH